MQIDTFRAWLTERGCHFDTHQHRERPQGHVVVTVHREGRTTTLPTGGARADLDEDEVKRACDELGLDWHELPGPASRV